MMCSRSSVALLPLLLISVWSVAVRGGLTELRSVEELTKRLSVVEDVNQQLHQKVAYLEETVSQLQNLQISVRSLTNTLTKLQQPSVNPKTSSQREALPRTCWELRSSNPSTPSGTYFIDPDGTDIGDNPIMVYCNMETGTTVVSHDSQDPTEVPHCVNPGCYSRTIFYNATMKQISALISLSDSCFQRFQYECLASPFEHDFVQYAWWNDRYGQPQYYWARDNSSVHTCDCGLTQTCADNQFKCNCDAIGPILLNDNGSLTNKTALPVTELHFGHLLFDQSVGIHTLGPLQCEGLVAPVTGTPQSCADLWLSGQTVSGIYHVKKTPRIAAVFCDFSKLPSETDFEVFLGLADVKSREVYFTVYRSSVFFAEGQTITYEDARVNEGNAVNVETGVFTAPVAGFYSFSFQAQRVETDAVGTRVHLQKNAETVVASHASGVAGAPLSVVSILELQTGDQVRAVLKSGSLFDNLGEHFTQFSGALLTENLLLP